MVVSAVSAVAKRRGSAVSAVAKRRVRGRGHQCICWWDMNGPVSERVQLLARRSMLLYGCVQAKGMCVCVKKTATVEFTSILWCIPWVTGSPQKVSSVL